jgi:pimeloyl-ACP methyl ester carboxylesterase
MPVMGLVVVDDIEMYFESRGSGPVLLVIGGLGIEMSELDTLIGPLSARSRVVAFDNRGAGRSSKPRGPYSIEQMAGDAAALMDRLDLPCAHVLGISMGGRIAMALALAHPARVDRLVLVSTGPRAGGARWLVRLGMLVADLPGLRGTHRQPRHALKAQFDATSRFDCSQRLGEIDQPTLILHGSLAHIAPVALAEQMHDRIPNSRLVPSRVGICSPSQRSGRSSSRRVGPFLRPAGNDHGQA